MAWLYYTSNSGSTTNRIIPILICSFGFIISYTFGLFLSFNHIVSTIALGIFSFAVHWIVLHYKSSPPGSFFFILIASLSICQPFNLQAIPTKIGLIGLGTMLSCVLSLIYIFKTSLKNGTKKEVKVIPVLQKNAFANFWEAIIFGMFISISMAVGLFIKKKYVTLPFVG